MRSWVRLVCLSASYWYLVSAQNDKECVPPKGKPGCVCDTEDGTIDLTSIANRHDEPLFKGQAAGHPDFNYFYNPCFPFTIDNPEGPCSFGNVSACQVSTDGKWEYALGSTTSETMFETASGNFYLSYEGDAQGRTTKVTLFCNESYETPEIITFGDHNNPDLVYEFDLYSKCCCPGACGSGGVAAGIIGLVLMPLFLVGIALYFLIGALVLKFGFHKEGSDMIPNKDWWVDFPFLLKDGVMFTFGPCVEKIQERKYTTI